jgi:ferric-dicitrate binding protein FerR (iron transport regulator)
MALSFPRYARVLASLLRKGGESEPPAPAPLDRADAVALIAGAIDRRQRRRSHARWTLATLSAAALFSAGLGLSHLGGKNASSKPAGPAGREVAPAPSMITVVAYAAQAGSLLEAQRAAEPMGPGRPLGAGSVYRTDSTAGATFALSTGTWISVEPASELTVVELGSSELFALTAGSIKADVAKLAPSDRFVIRTEDADVEVRGTSFRVSVVPADPACGNGTRTRVWVFEGVVVVRSNGGEEAVVKGREWPTGCSSTRPAAPPVATHAPATTVSTPPTTPTPVEIASSNLAAQNDLFAEGMRSKQNGDTAAALAAFDRLLSRYPTGQLAENAAVERMKLLASIDRRRAVGAASQYLARYPSGFARAAAESILHDRH